MADHGEAGWNVLQHLGDIFADLLHRAAALGAGLSRGQVCLGHTRKMLRQRAALLRRNRFDRKRLTCWLRHGFCANSFQLFELQFQLLDLSLDLLRPAPELHATQLSDQQQQMLDLALVRE